MQDGEVPDHVLERIVRLVNGVKDTGEPVEILTPEEVEAVRKTTPHHTTLVDMAKSREAMRLVLGKGTALLGWVTATVAMIYTLREQISTFLGGFLK